RIEVEVGGYSVERNLTVEVVHRFSEILLEGVLGCYTNRTYEVRLVGLDEGGGELGGVEWHVRGSEGIEVEVDGDILRFYSEEAGEYVVEVEGEYRGQRVWKNITLEVRWEPYLYRVELEVDGREVVVRAYDQYGNEITGNCSIEYSGDYEEVGYNRVRVSGDRLEVKVIYGDRSITKEVEFRSGGEGGKGLIGYIVVVVVSMVVVGVLIVLNRRGMLVIGKKN
ncbi:MAG: hypothetical protein J7L88_03020, partial [Thermoplasmata archaeon]|nr:hypothetical protein [Thermoplasmata archaeon]